MRLAMAIFGVAMVIGAALAFAQVPPVMDAGPGVVVSPAVSPGPVPLWAHDDAATPVEQDPVGIVRELWNALNGGRYWYAFGLVLMVMTFAFRWLTKIRDEDNDGVDDPPNGLAGRVRHWLNSTDPGRVLSLGITALLSTSALMIVAGVGPSWALAKAVGLACVGAMGGFAVVFKLVLPLLKALWAKVS